MNSAPPAPLGRITTESSDEYHAQDAVSASRLRVLRRKPGGAQLYHQTYIAKALPREETEAMREGQALHTYVLEPEKFEKEFAVRPEGIDRRTTAGKVAWEKFLIEAKGKTIIDVEMLARVVAMGNQIKAHPAAGALIAQGVAETTWRINAPGLKHLPPLQCRTDWFNEAGHALSEGRPYVLDLKTCATLEVDAFSNFQRAVEDHAYHCQAALYMAIMSALGMECRDFFFVAVEKCAPYGVEVYRLGDRALERGQLETESMLMQLDGCYRRNIWPNTDLGVKELKLSPRYWANVDREEAA